MISNHLPGLGTLRFSAVHLISLFDSELGMYAFRGATIDA